MARSLSRCGALESRGDEARVCAIARELGPDGAYLAGPVFDEETLVIADLDLEAIDRELMTLDVAGHYARPDVFAFEMKKTRV